MTRPEPPARTVFPLSYQDLRSRWGRHHIRVLISLAVGFLLGAAIAVAYLGYGRVDIAIGIFLVDVLAVQPYTCYHFGAARTVTKLMFGEDL